MSARDQMAAMLDELMGPKRNVELGKDTKVTFDDPNICPYFLVGFCPHDMFTNTKADLGACHLVHDDNMRRMYPESPECGRLGFERRLLRFLVQLDEDNLRRIKKNKEKLAGMDDQGKRKKEEEINRTKSDIDNIDSELKEIMKLAEEAGIQGNVSKCQELVAKSEELANVKSMMVEKLDKLENEPQNPMVPPMMEDLQVKPMEVCETCGSMLIINDAAQRVEEHLTGKMHTGFQKIRTMIEELKIRLKKQDEEEDQRREERRKERRSTDKRRSGSREKSRERDRERRKRSRSRSPYRGSGSSRSGSGRDRRDDRRYDRGDRDRGGNRDRYSRDRRY